jgi:hypothetical protein
MAIELAKVEAVLITEDKLLVFFGMSLPSKLVRDKVMGTISALFRCDLPCIAPANVIRLGYIGVFVELLQPMADYGAVERLIWVLANQHDLDISTVTRPIEAIEAGRVVSQGEIRSA